MWGVLGARRVKKVAVALTLATLVSGALLESAASASNVLTLRAAELGSVIEPGTGIQGGIGLGLTIACFDSASGGKLETNQSGTDKVGFSGATEKACFSEEAGYSMTPGRLTSITATAGGVATVLFSPAIKLTVPGPCIYQLPNKWPAAFPIPALSFSPAGEVRGTLIKAGSSPSCAHEATFPFESGAKLFTDEGEGLSTETQLAAYKAEAKVQKSGGGCGEDDGNPFIGTAKFTRASASSTVTVTYKVKGALPNTVFQVGLMNTTGFGPGLCQFVGPLTNKTTKATTFTTNENGEGSFTGGVPVPRNDTEFFAYGGTPGQTQVDPSLHVTLP
jgi:hypothetical protein